MFGDNWFLVHQLCLLSTGVRFGDRNVERGLQENRACEHRSHAVNTKLSGSGQSSHDLLSIQCWNGINRPSKYSFIICNDSSYKQTGCADYGALMCTLKFPEQIIFHYHPQKCLQSSQWNMMKKTIILASRFFNQLCLAEFAIFRDGMMAVEPKDVLLLWPNVICDSAITGTYVEVNG